MEIFNALQGENTEKIRPAEDSVTFDYVPRCDYFRPAVLKVLSDGRVRTAEELYIEACDILKLSESAKREKIPSGGLRYETQISWACSSLFKAGLIRRIKNGVYEITADGGEVSARNLTVIRKKDLSEWSSWREYQRKKPQAH